MMMNSKLLLSTLILPVAACSATKEIDVQIIDPCNQQAVETMDFLELKPRGTGIDSDALTTIEERASGGLSQPLEIPLVEDFQLVVTGRRGTFDSEVAGLGVSPATDLVNGPDQQSVKVPFALVNSFYRTTDLSTGSDCSFPGVARHGATATYIPDNGAVLIVGGAELATGMDGTEIRYPRTIELYDPGTGTFRLVGELRVGGARANHTATYIGEGRVLIAGGESRNEGSLQALKSAFVIEALDTNAVTVGSETLIMKEARTGHVATVLSDGRVVFSGGREIRAGGPMSQIYSDTLEIFDPAERIFAYINDAQGNRLSMGSARYGHTATALAPSEAGSQRVMIAGGQDGTAPVLSAELLDLGGEGTNVMATLSVANDAVGIGAIFHAAAPFQNEAFPNGAVLLSGGYPTIADAEPNGALPSNPSGVVEMWTVEGGSLVRKCTSSLTAPRGFHTVSTGSRRAFFIGGRDDTGAPSDTAEIAELSVGANCFREPPSTQRMADRRTRHSMSVIESSGEILVFGGLLQMNAAEFGESLKSAEIFSPKRVP